MSFFDPQHRTNESGQIAIALYRIAQSINYLFRETGKKTKLSPAQIKSLIFLKYARVGVRMIGGLADRLGVSYASTSGVADSLEKKELIQRSPNRNDRRITELILTKEGETEVAEIQNLLDALESAISELSDEEQKVLLTATQSIVRQLQKEGYVHIYEMCWGCQFFRKNAHPQDPAGPHHCAFIDEPLAEPNTYHECPDFIPVDS